VQTRAGKVMGRRKGSTLRADPNEGGAAPTITRYIKFARRPVTLAAGKKGGRFRNEKLWARPKYTEKWGGPLAPSNPTYP